LSAEKPDGLSGEKILGAMRGDKKARSGRIEYALPRRIGAMAGAESGWAVSVEDELVREVLA
jgi:3-dehydroquinate synthetase